MSGRRSYPTDRTETLIEALERHYGHRDPWEVCEQMEPDATDIVHDLFRVLRVFPGGMNLICNDEFFEVFVWEKDVLPYVWPGNVFSMTIFRSDDEWRLWYMSAPCSS